jgi:hypothetical protein
MNKNDKNVNRPLQKRPLQRIDPFKKRSLQKKPFNVIALGQIQTDCNIQTMAKSIHKLVIA